MRPLCVKKLEYFCLHQISKQILSRSTPQRKNPGFCQAHPPRGRLSGVKTRSHKPPSDVFLSCLKSYLCNPKTNSGGNSKRIAVIPPRRHLCVSSIMQPPPTDLSKIIPAERRTKREHVLSVVIVWEERAVLHHWTRAGKQHKGPVQTLLLAVALGQVPCSLCKLNPTSHQSDLHNCITALVQPIPQQLVDSN